MGRPFDRAVAKNAPNWEQEVLNRLEEKKGVTPFSFDEAMMVGDQGAWHRMSLYGILNGLETFTGLMRQDVDWLNEHFPVSLYGDKSNRVLREAMFYSKAGTRENRLRYNLCELLEACIDVLEKKMVFEKGKNLSDDDKKALAELRNWVKEREKDWIGSAKDVSHR
ncbi:MAG: hypothetical protein SFT92_00620 [Rickettsiales bacterium]|nr:hypothetical protein [Rickettsiales bacterium]